MKVLVVLGTRPECIKLAPVIHELRRRRVALKVCVTAQHREMLDPFLQFFELPVDWNLGIMKSGQDLYDVTTAALTGLKGVLADERPDLVIVQGDTTTAFAAALAAFYEKIPVAHVEAGLRTGDPRNPFPEEINRRLIDHVATWLFAPTEGARNHLLAEGISADRIFVTGNTIVDALSIIVDDERFRAMRPAVAGVDGSRTLLVTAHRRESFGEPFEQICRAVQRISQANPDVEVVYPVHLNPNVRSPAHRMLGGTSRIHLIQPLDYLPFLKQLEQAYLVLTDSGGVQEEAPTLRTPVLVMRDVTERPEGIDVGVARLVGTSTERIVSETQRVLDDGEAYEAMRARPSPYGDGHAAARIVDVLANA